MMATARCSRRELPRPLSSKRYAGCVPSMPHNFVLVHSPLIGPYSWRLVADHLADSGHSVTVPSLLSVLGRSSDFPDAVAEAVASHMMVTDFADPLLLVAHSAAGAFLPVIASRLQHKVSGYIFVDARLPQDGRSLSDQDPPEERSQLRSLAKEGFLPPWSEWFGPDVMAALLPDHESRRAFVQELRPIPLAFFVEPIKFPQTWPDAPCAYLRLSEYYVNQAQQARAEGWHVTEVDAEHLYPMTHPQEMTSLLLEAVAAMDSEWHA
jgi:hypothetical protein